MEETLRQHLLDLGRIYASSDGGVSLSGIGKLALNDNTAFSRLRLAESGFNIRTYDRLVHWFSENWPHGVAWPADVPCPNRHLVEGNAA